MIERGNPLLKQTPHVPDNCQTRSSHESISFNVGDETLRDRMEQPVVNHDDSVEGINPAPHIHEQMATTNYVQMATTLRTPLRITTSRLSTMR